MKIAADCRMIECSGIGTFIKGILPFLLDHNNSEWILIGNNDVLDKYKSNRVSIIKCDTPCFSIKEHISFPFKEINQCDAYFTPYFNIPIGIRIPVLTTIHDVIFFDVKGLTSKIGTYLRKLYLAFSIRRSNSIITVSKFSASRIQFHFPRVKNIDVCYNGANINLLNVKEKTDEYSFPNDFYLFVGNIKRHKGLDVLLSTFRELPDYYKLVIVGNKDNFRTRDSKISQILDDLTSSSKIIFTGRISDGTLKYLLKRANALIQPSKYEGFGIPPLEAMLLGTPAIISDIEVFQEVYSEFPVIFFREGDSIDLASKIQNLSNKRIFLPDSLRNRYSYRNSAEIIWQRILKLID